MFQCIDRLMLVLMNKCNEYQYIFTILEVIKNFFKRKLQN